MPLALRVSLFTCFAAILSATALFLPAAAPAADKDCADFASQRAAQIFFIKHGGPRYDPHRLDGDNDNVACEDNRCPCYYGKQLPHRPALALVGDRRYAWQI